MEKLTKCFINLKTNIFKGCISLTNTQRIRLWKDDFVLLMYKP